MGKPTGFMEYDREETTAVEPKERIRNFNEFHIPSQKKNAVSGVQDVWTAECRSASPAWN